MVDTPEEIRAFEERYAARSGVTVEWLHRHGRFGETCNCRQPFCEGFEMAHAQEDAIVEDQSRSPAPGGAP